MNINLEFSMKSLALLILIPSLAIAGEKPPETPVSTPAVAVAGAVAVSGSTSIAAGGSAVSSTGDSVSLSHGGSTGPITITETNPRQTPGVAQGSFAIQGCAVAGNAGGSNVGGTGFLGFSFTPQQCYDFQLAQAYAALGAKESACQVLNKSKAGKRAEKRGVTLPTCTPPVTAVPTQTASTGPVVSVPRETNCASKEYVGEVVGRAVKACSSK